MTKEQLIKNLKKEAQKATSKVIASTFDTNIRNSATRQIQIILADKIKEVQAL